jgi:hypothetical protein
MDLRYVAVTLNLHLLRDKYHNKLTEEHPQVDLQLDVEGRPGSMFPFCKPL